MGGIFSSASAFYKPTSSKRSVTSTQNAHLPLFFQERSDLRAKADRLQLGLDVHCCFHTIFLDLLQPLRVQFKFPLIGIHD